MTDKDNEEIINSLYFLTQLVMLCRDLSSEVIRLKVSRGFNTSA